MSKNNFCEFFKSVFNVRLIQNNYMLYKYFKNSPFLKVAEKLELQIETIISLPNKDNVVIDVENSLSKMHYMLDVVLNTGHYSEIEEKFRSFFAFICALRAKFYFLKCDYFKALHACDDGLLKGNDILDGWLSSFAQFLCIKVLPAPNNITNSHPSKELACPPNILNSSEIASIELPSMDEFYSEYFLKNKPLVIKGIVNKWPAFQKWNFSFLNQTLGHRIFPIELGSKYTDEDWCQKLMTFNEFLRIYIFENNLKKIGYLAQHRLFDQVPSLLEDIIIPDYCAFGDNGLNYEYLTINVFIGPQGTVSPLHMDPRHNFFCQILGRKFVRLINPIHKNKIALFDDFLRKNTSQIDVEQPNKDVFPNFSEAICEDYILEPGNCLFIPRGYFHHVRALEPSISVSIWFDT